MITPDKKRVKKLSNKYTYIPLYERIPLGRFDVTILYEQFRGPYTCLFETQDESHTNRYCVIGLSGQQRLVSDGITSCVYSGGTKEVFHGHPIERLKDLMKQTSPSYPELPFFTGGAIGHVNYDAIRLYEAIDDKDKDSLQLPMMQFIWYDELLVVDEEKACIYIIVNILSGYDEREYERVIERIEKRKQQLLSCEVKRVSQSLKMHHFAHSNMEKKQFMKMVEKAKEYIKQGEIFQVVLSQRFACEYKEDPFLAYKNLRTMGCSPYLYYFDFDEYCIAGISPEMLLKSQGNHLYTMPIAGTRKRGVNASEDERLMKELQADAKEVSEHMMLVDLARNDMGRVAKIGSVLVERSKEVHLYSHVMHMTTSVQAILAEGKSVYDALFSLFPAGTLSGAPKIKAMQIIDELEDTRREVYAGTIALLGYNGVFDTCITIRTLLFHKQMAYIQAGAGIVKDSDPRKEYQETLQKGSALLQALGCEVVG